jgi:hypothetical protein
MLKSIFIKYITIDKINSYIYLHFFMFVSFFPS